MCVVECSFFLPELVPTIMSNTAAKEEEIERSRLLSPNLDFTGRIRSILDGDDSILSPTNEVPSIPADVEDMDIQESINNNDNDGLIQNPSKAKENVEENPGDKIEAVEDDQFVGNFFGLEVEQQSQFLVDYRNNIHKLSSQNKELLSLLETVDQD